MPKENGPLRVEGPFIDIRRMLYQFIADKSVRVIMSRIRFIAVGHVISYVAGARMTIFLIAYTLKSRTDNDNLYTPSTGRTRLKRKHLTLKLT